MALFPEIGLDETKFEFHQSIYLLYFTLFAFTSLSSSFLSCFISALQRWQDTGKRREFFEEFAAENDFDPLVAGNWYKVYPDAIQDREVFFLFFFFSFSCFTYSFSSFILLVLNIIQGADSLLHCYQGSVGRALAHLFPDVGIDQSFFPFYTRKYI